VWELREKIYVKRKRECLDVEKRNVLFTAWSFQDYERN